MNRCARAAQGRMATRLQQLLGPANRLLLYTDARTPSRLGAGLAAALEAAVLVAGAGLPSAGVVIVRVTTPDAGDAIRVEVRSVAGGAEDRLPASLLQTWQAAVDGLEACRGTCVEERPAGGGWYVRLLAPRDGCDDTMATDRLPPRGDS